MKFMTGLDKERVNAEDPAIVADWFKLFERTITMYNVHIDDIYNMDEKGCMIGVIGKCKVIISQHKRKQYITTVWKLGMGLINWVYFNNWSTTATVVYIQSETTLKGLVY